MDDLREHPQLLARFRSGDDEAADTEVYWLVLPRLKTLVKSAFHIRNPADRDDLIQETLCRAFKLEARLAYSGDTDYWSYLSVIARNVYLNRRRTRGRELLARNDESSVDDDDVVNLFERAATIDPTPEHGWLEPRALEITREYVASLTGPLRAVHGALYVQSLSERGAMDQLGFARGKVRKLKDRLRRELLARLKRAGIRKSNVPSLERTSGGSYG